MFTENRKYLPFPEAIDRDDVPDRFDVRVGNESRTDLTHGVMVVNGGEVCECGQDHARATRLHEMGHVAWTPADWQKRTERAKDAPPLVLTNAVEDARLTLLRRRNGLEDSPAILCEAKGEHQNIITNAIKSGDLVGFASLLAAAHLSRDDSPFALAVGNIITELVDKGEHEDEVRVIQKVQRAVNYALHKNLLSKGKPSFRSTISAAREIYQALADIEEEYREAKEAKEGAKKTVVKEVKEKTGPKDTWGTMSIVEVPLTRHSSLGMERRWTARDEGPIPTRFDRWSIDKRVFRAKKRVKGAAVLVDCSSSMRWDEDDLKRVLEEVPAATVAIYSGHGPGGKLVIVAKKGRRATWSVVKPHKMGGNVIDGPALAWLASQPEQVKVWMSDGGVTGPGDRHSNAEHRERMERDVQRHLRRGGIMRVRTVDDVMKVLTGKQKFLPDRVFRTPWR